MLFSRFGAMMSAEGGAQLVTTHSGALAFGSGVVSLAGASAGDLAVVFIFNDLDGAVTAPAGWTTDSVALASLSTQVFTKVLTAAEATAGTATWTDGGGGFHANSYVLVAIYRGVAAATRKATATGSGATLALTGFTKSGLSRGIVSFAGTYDTVVPTAPTSFTAEVSGTFAASRAAAADLLASPKYVNGASVTWTGFNGAATKYAWLMELTA